MKIEVNKYFQENSFLLVGANGTYAGLKDDKIFWGRAKIIDIKSEMKGNSIIVKSKLAIGW